MYAKGIRKGGREMRFIEKVSKPVKDADGFYTDYTMYFDTEINWYVFVFGDKDIYLPENSDFDWTCETEDEAWEWFDSYNGFEDYESDYGDEEPWGYEERNYQRLHYD
jgi:hypothetical protein